MKTLAALFPGQGTQKWGMGKELYDQFEEAKDVFQKADSILGYSFSNLLFETPSDMIMDTSIGQIAIFLTSIAYYKCFIEKYQIVPTVFAGHSIGEYAALVCSGMISFEDGLCLVQERGRQMQLISDSNKGGAMFAVLGLSYSEVESICNECIIEEKQVTIANYNAKKQIVISGMESDLLCAQKKVEERNGKVKKLAVNTAFHSTYMKDAQAPLAAMIKKVEVRDIPVTVYSNVTGKPYQNAKEVKELLSSQITKAVRWYDITSDMQENAITTFVEIGFGTVLGNLLRHDKCQENQVYSLSRKNDCQSFLNKVVSGHEFGGTYLVGLMLGKLVANRLKDGIVMGEKEEEMYQNIRQVYVNCVNNKQVATKQQVKSCYDSFIYLSEIRQIWRDREFEQMLRGIVN